jgi:hypothetical protein
MKRFIRHPSGKTVMLDRHGTAHASIPATNRRRCWFCSHNFAASDARISGASASANRANTFFRHRHLIGLQGYLTATALSQNWTAAKERYRKTAESTACESPSEPDAANNFFDTVVSCTQWSVRDMGFSTKAADDCLSPRRVTRSMNTGTFA